LLTGADVPSSDIVADLSPAGINSALPLLYPGEDVQGNVLPVSEMATACGISHKPQGWSDDATPHFGGKGIRVYASGTFIPYSRVVVLRYTRVGQGHLEVIHGDLALEGNHCRIPSHTERIGHAGVPSSQWRTLVADDVAAGH